MKMAVFLFFKTFNLSEYFETFNGNVYLKEKANWKSYELWVPGSELTELTNQINNDDDNKSSSKDGLKRIGGGGIDLEASENSNSVKVESGSWSEKTKLEIEVPTGMDLDVSTYNSGDLIITNVQGELELKNYNGEITALNISGSVVATTYNGDVKVTFDIVTDGTPMSYCTYNGDIDLTFPATVKAIFKMKTEQGDIYTGFDMNITSSGPIKQQDNKSGAYKLKIDDWKRGDVNGGGAEVTMKNYNGDIYIRKKWHCPNWHRDQISNLKVEARSFVEYAQYLTHFYSTLNPSIYLIHERNTPWRSAFAFPRFYAGAHYGAAGNWKHALVW